MVKIQMSVEFLARKIFFLLFMLVLSNYSSLALSRTLIFQSDAEKNSKTQVQSINPEQVSETYSTPPVIQNPSVSANTELFFMIEQLQQEVNLLRGALEEQAHELRLLKQSSKDRYLDLDTRVLDITKRLSSIPVVSSAVNQLSASPAKVTPAAELPLTLSQAEVKTNSAVKVKQREPTKAELDDYQKAYAYIKEKQFDDSILALFNYTENYPNSPLLPNVYYWLGEVYLATSKLEQAKTSFSLVISAYPDSQKAADSLYKLAVTVDSLGDKALAKQYIQDVQNKYPESTAAKLASSYQFKE